MNTEANHPLIGKRYELRQQLGKGGMGTVYRAVDRLTGEMIALKRVSAPADQLVFATVSDRNQDSRLSLAQEFRTLASLRHPNIISVLDYGFDESLQPYFTMDLLENAQTILQAGCDQTFRLQLELFIQMLQA